MTIAARQISCSITMVLTYFRTTTCRPPGRFFYVHEFDITFGLSKLLLGLTYGSGSAMADNRRVDFSDLRKRADFRAILAHYGLTPVGKGADSGPPHAGSGGAAPARTGHARACRAAAADDAVLLARPRGCSLEAGAEWPRQGPPVPVQGPLSLGARPCAVAEVAAFLAATGVDLAASGSGAGTGRSAHDRAGRGPAAMVAAMARLTRTLWQQ
jgi:hypothetical protein